MEKRAGAEVAMLSNKELMKHRRDLSFFFTRILRKITFHRQQSISILMLFIIMHEMHFK